MPASEVAEKEAVVKELGGPGRRPWMKQTRERATAREGRVGGGEGQAEQ